MTAVLLRPAEHPGALAQPHVDEDGAALSLLHDPLSAPGWLNGSDLLAIARGLARNAHLWPEMSRPRRRSWDLMVASEDFEAWVIAWPPGGAIELHDHGDAAGAVVVASGELVETAVTGAVDGPARTGTTVLTAGDALTFDATRVHDIVNAGPLPAISVHVYAPRLTVMTFYEIHDGRLEPGRRVRYRLGEATA